MFVKDCLQVSIKKPTYCQLLNASNQMFVDVILSIVVILFYRTNLMCFVDHLNSLSLIFCPFSFIILISKGMHLI